MPMNEKEPSEHDDKHDVGAQLTVDAPLSREIEGRDHPIPTLPLLQAFSIFTLYAAVASFVMGWQSSRNVDLSAVERVVLEPLSFVAFSTISLVGLLGLTLTYIFWAPSGSQMRNSRFVQCVLCPIANTGVTTGAIVLGAMVGTSIGLGLWTDDPGAERIVQIMLALAAYTLALLWPLVWMMRSLFDETRRDEYLTSGFGFLYCAALLLTLWLVSREQFWVTVIAMGISGLLAFAMIRFFALRKAKRRSVFTDG